MKKLLIIAALIVIGVVSYSILKPKNELIRTNLLGFQKSDVLDPAHLRFIQEYFILDNITVKLIGTGSNNEYENELAKNIIFSPDKTTIDIELKQAQFSDGSPITAEDVSASFKRSVIIGSPHTNIKNLWVGSENLKSINDDVEGIQVVDKYKLRLKLTRATKELLFFLSLTDMAVLHKSQYIKEKILVEDWMNLSSGAYKIGYNPDNKLILTANTSALTYSPDMPKVVTFESYKGDDVMKRLADRSLDFGMITFKDYLDNVETIESVKGFDIVGNKADGVVYIGLNIKSPIFSKKENRQWIQKKIIQSFAVSEKYQKAASKAFQFFLPNAKGHIPTAKVEAMLPDVDTSKVPADLKNGIVIKSISGMKDYSPADLEQSLTQALGIPVKVDLTIPNKEYLKFMSERKYDATIMGFGMSYKVLGEALNLQYLSENPNLLDPTGQVKQLLKQYQDEENTDKEAELISKILEQMVTDAECVPLFYFSAPFFVKTASLQASDLDLDESVKFYKAKLK